VLLILHLGGMDAANVLVRNKEWYRPSSKKQTRQVGLQVLRNLLTHLQGHSMPSLRSKTHFNFLVLGLLTQHLLITKLDCHHSQATRKILPLPMHPKFQSTLERASIKTLPQSMLTSRIRMLHVVQLEAILASEAAKGLHLR
jgi:hypothetical protein